MVAHVKISGLPHADAPTGEELIEVVQNGVNKQLKVTHLFVKGLDGKDGMDGQNGQNAYELALEDGFEGSKQQWQESLKGPSAYDMAVAQGFQGTPKEWVDSLKPPSAYDMAKAAGFEGDPQAWLQSLKGRDGVDGIDGISPPNNYELAKSVGFEGSLSDWLDSLKGKDGVDGESVYDIAKRLGFEGTQSEFLTSLQGKDGRDGVTPPDNYHWWLSFQDNPETLGYEDYINAIRGYPGKDGTNGKDGKNGLSGGESVYLDNGVFSSAGGTFTFDANVANFQAVQMGAPMTIKFANLPPAGLGGEYLLKLINGGAFTLTWGTPIHWQLPQGGYTTSFGEYGIGLLSNGADFIFLWTDGDGSGTLYGKVMR